MLTLSDSYELIANNNEVSLRLADSPTIPLESIKIVRWANLPNDHKVVDALLKYKAEQSGI